MSDASEPVTRSIFCIETTYGRAPFFDGSRIHHRALGCYSTLDTALSWIRSDEFREDFASDDEDERLLVIRIVERALDVGASDYCAHVTISRTGEVLERRVRGDEDDPWQGRDPSSCRWKRGDVAACVYNDCYRIGVVLSPPRSMSWVRERGGGAVTRMDDVYLLGFPDGDHDHPSVAEMFEPLAHVPEELRLRLIERLGKLSASD